MQNHIAKFTDNSKVKIGKCNRFHFRFQMGRKTINQGIDRRQILIGVAALMGGSLLPGSVAALENSDAGARDASFSVLTKKQFRTLSVIADIILPETDTPGAVGVGVPSFIDWALDTWLLPEETSAFLAGLENFSQQNARFLTANSAVQETVVRSLDQQLHNLPNGLEFYRQLKELVLIGYYTSEIGATLELAYDPIPGGYQPFTTENSVKAWAT